MTNSEDIVVDGKKEDDERKIVIADPKKDIPYGLPGDAQLFSYLQYKKSRKKSQKTRESSDTTDTRITETTIKNHKNEEIDINQLLLKELSKIGNQGIGYTFSRKRYVNDARKLSRRRLLVGQKRDACLQLDQQLEIERKKFHEIKHRYKECAIYLEAFLSREHADSMNLLNAADKELKRTNELSQRRDSLSRKYGHTRLEVYHWEEAWRRVRACHRFVIQVAPLGDGYVDENFNDNDDDDDGTDELEDVDDDDAGSLITTMTVASGLLGEYGHGSSLRSLIETFEREINSLPKNPSTTPKDLGLSDVNDLLRTFRTMELQNLNALVNLESLGGPMTSMIERIDVAEVKVRREIDDVLEDIDRLEISISREDRRARQLESDCVDLVQHGFRALVCSEDALRERVLIEDAYVTCCRSVVGDDSSRVNVKSLVMARTLENVYERLSAQLDLLPQHLVQACEREGFLREFRDNREAEDAARKFELMHRLLASLKRMMEPSEPKRRQRVFRSVPIIKKHQPRRKNIVNAIDNDNKNPTTSSRDEHFDFFSNDCTNAGRNDGGGETGMNFSKN